MNNSPARRTDFNLLSFEAFEAFLFISEDLSFQGRADAFPNCVFE